MKEEMTLGFSAFLAFLLMAPSTLVWLMYPRGLSGRSNGYYIAKDFFNLIFWIPRKILFRRYNRKHGFSYSVPEASYYPEDPPDGHKAKHEYNEGGAIIIDIHNS